MHRRFRLRRTDVAVEGIRIARPRNHAEVKGDARAARRVCHGVVLALVAPKTHRLAEPRPEREFGILDSGFRA